MVQRCSAFDAFQKQLFFASQILAGKITFAGAQRGLAGRSKFCGFNPFGQAVELASLRKTSLHALYGDGGDSHAHKGQRVKAASYLENG